MKHLRNRLQLAEALGPSNRWYCSKAHGREITDCEVLVAYYIRSKGAKDFAKRYDEAMGPENRWYCSEFYGREIRDLEILWEYYMMNQGRDAKGRASAAREVRSSGAHS
jgi:hypothetical protein